MRNRPSLMVGLGIAAIVLLGMAPSFAEEAKELPKTTLERAEQEMLTLRNQIVNAGHRLKRNLQSMDQGGTLAEAATPARLCCNHNLQAMKKTGEALKQIAVELAACYEKAGNKDSMMVLPLIETDLSTLDRTVEAFGGAPTKTEAHGAMGAVTQAFLHLRDDMDKLEECPGPPAEKTGGKAAKTGGR